MVKGIVFDKDGTLFDFNATWGAWTLGFLQREFEGDLEKVSRAAEALGYDVSAQSFTKDSVVIANTANEIADTLIAALGEAPGRRSKPEMIRRMNEEAAKCQQVPAADLKRFVADLIDRGLRVGVATNDAEIPARSHLGAHGVADLFEYIVGYDSGYGAKPEPGQLLGFCAQTGLAPEECVMVGDSTHDLFAGKAAGFLTIGVLTGLAEEHDLAPHADAVLTSIAELPRWLDQNA